MSRSAAVARFAAEFGPLIAFWVTNAAFGLKPAIAVSMVVALAELARFTVRRETPGHFFLFSVAMTLLFGTVDLLLTQPKFLAYESVVTNLATAVFFGVTAFGRKPLIFQFAERSGRLSGNRPPDLVPFFRVFTLVWAGYFVAKAALYGWMAGRFDLRDATAIRMVVGPASFYALLGVSMFGGRTIYRIMRWSGALAIAVRLFPGDKPEAVSGQLP